MALAANVRNYRPPARIVQMEEHLAALAGVWENTPMAGPWGWSLAAKQRYLRMGVDASLLPSDAYLDELRRLSSRQFACGYVREMLSEWDDGRLLGREMRFCTDLPQTSAFPMIYKSPWSSSGRGVFVSSSLDRRTLSRLSGFLSFQGGYAADRFYEDKAVDFALEYFVGEGGAVDFLGYSVFCASAGGNYGYNFVESQERLRARIKVNSDLLSQIVDYHGARLAALPYRGPVGIDMLATSEGKVHPCVEINFRMNMGILALLLFQRYGEGCTVELTPPRSHGFEAAVQQGRLQIAYKP